MPSFCCLPGRHPEGINASELDPSHFAEVGRLGEGGFGLVLLMEKLSKPAKGRHFAVKKMSKALITSHELYAEVHQELKVAQRLSHPFLCRHYAAFQDNNHLYLVLELLSGGNLAHHLDQSGPIGERRIRFYASCLTLALAHMRSVGVVHRDIKPTNILLRADGYLVLADFGLAAIVDRTQVCSDDRARLVGTHGYVAPELYRDSHRHSFASDCYSLGVVLFECGAGTMPTAVPRALAEQSNTGVWVSSGSQRKEKPPSAPLSAEKLELYASQLSSTEQVSKEFADCVARLLLPDARARLGSASLSELKRHPWLEPLDWVALRHMRVPPPWLPPPAPGIPQPGQAARGGAQLSSSTDSKEERHVCDVAGVANFQTQRLSRPSQASNQETQTPSFQHTSSKSLSHRPRGSQTRVSFLGAQKSGSSQKLHLSAQDLAKAQQQFAGYTWNVQLRSRFLPKSASLLSMAHRGSSRGSSSGRNMHSSVFGDDRSGSAARASQIHTSPSMTSNSVSFTASHKGASPSLSHEPSQGPSQVPSLRGMSERRDRLTASLRSRRGKNCGAVAPVTEHAPSAAPTPYDRVSQPEDLFMPAQEHGFAESLRDMFSSPEGSRKASDRQRSDRSLLSEGSAATIVLGPSSPTMGVPSPGKLQ